MRPESGSSLFYLHVRLAIIRPDILCIWVDKFLLRDENFTCQKLIKNKVHFLPFTYEGIKHKTHKYMILHIDQQTYLSEKNLQKYLFYIL